MHILENYSLKKLNTFGIEVFSKYFTLFRTVDEAREIISNPKYKSLPRLILGGGSNILFCNNFDGIVIKNNLKGIEITGEDENHFYVKAQAGENWHEFVSYCVQNNYAGIENLSLIPGNVGASPMQNIGAYGVEIKDVFYQLEALHIETGETHTFSNQECKFGYRESIFKNEVKGQYIITSVTYRLNKKAQFNTSYGAIEQELVKMNIAELSIAAVSKAVCNIRSSKLPNPAEIGNAGSFFKNPVIENTHFEKLKVEFPSIPSYPQPNGTVKIAAGWLIEQCNWKGQRLGDAGVHKNQALVLVNYGNANGSEIYDLSSKILESVKNKFGIELEREVNIIG